MLKFSYMLRFLLIFFLFFPVVSFAQNIDLDRALQRSYETIIFPSIPRPNTEVSVRILSLVNDGGTEIRWFVDGVLQEERGDIEFSVTTKGLGEETVVRAEIYRVNADGTYSLYGSANRTILPFDINVVVEPLVTVPYRYKGAPLHKQGVSVRFTVLVDGLTPNGRRLNKDDIQFVWVRGSSYLTDAGGERGLNSIVTRWPSLGAVYPIEVEMYIIPLEVTVSESISFESSVNQEVILYEHHPQIGYRYNRALTSPINIEGGQLGIVAEPYFFDNDLDLLDVRWFIGNDTERYGVFELLLGVGDVSAVETTENIRVRISNSKNLLQRAESEIIVSY